MDHNILAHFSIGLAAFALALAFFQHMKIRFLSRCHFGILAPAALRWQLRLYSLLRKRCAVIALDVRKMHDGNEVLGYSTMNAMVSDLVRVRLRPGRTLDVIGQYGGDEFIAVISDPSAGELVVSRLIGRMRELTAAMPAEKRAALAERTGGLVDGLHAAIALVPETRDAYRAAVQAVDKAGEIKAGTVTGNRSTSGTAGTQIAVVQP